MEVRGFVSAVREQFNFDFTQSIILLELEIKALGRLRPPSRSRINVRLEGD